MYGRREALLLSGRGFWLFPDRLIGGGDGGGLSTTLSPGHVFWGTQLSYIGS